MSIFSKIKSMFTFTPSEEMVAIREMYERMGRLENCDASWTEDGLGIAIIYPNDVSMVVYRHGVYYCPNAEDADTGIVFGGIGDHKFFDMVRADYREKMLNSVKNNGDNIRA